MSQLNPEPPLSQLSPPEMAFQRILVMELWNPDHPGACCPQLSPSLGLVAGLYEQLPSIKGPVFTGSGRNLALSLRWQLC